jgi:hypothetical protein
MQTTRTIEFCYLFVLWSMGRVKSIQLFGTVQETKIENLFKFNAVEIMMSFVARGWMVGYGGVELIK